MGDFAVLYPGGDVPQVASRSGLGVVSSLHTGDTICGGLWIPPQKYALEASNDRYYFSPPIDGAYGHSREKSGYTPPSVSETNSTLVCTPPEFGVAPTMWFSLPKLPERATDLPLLESPPLKKQRGGKISPSKWKSLLPLKGSLNPRENMGGDDYLLPSCSPNK